MCVCVYVAIEAAATLGSILNIHYTRYEVVRM